jgi:hypothetical protein
MLVSLAMFLHTHQNPLDGTAAGRTLVRFELISQAVEEARFHESLIIRGWKRSALHLHSLNAKSGLISRDFLGHVQQQLLVMRFHFGE